MTPSFGCSACWDNITDSEPLNIHGDNLCKGCFINDIRPQFEQALKSETAYPVKWANQEIDIYDFTRFFSQGFLIEWGGKVREYSTPTADRLYCAGTRRGERCSKFLGEKCFHRTAKKCSACKAQTCADCAGIIQGGIIQGRERHVCQTEQDANPFEGLQRGKDYQKCPKCDAAISLQDGCNHVVCGLPSCRTHMCFICGVEAGVRSGHWDVGKPCPKYNQPGAENTQFDRRTNEQARLAPPPHAQALLHVAATIKDDIFSPEPPNAPAEVRLRRADRQGLGRVERQAVLFGQESLENRAQSRIADMLAGVLKNSIDIYSLHLEQDHPLYQHRRTKVAVGHHLLQRLVGELGEGLDRFPTMRGVLDRYTMAYEGRLDELKQQLQN